MPKSLVEMANPSMEMAKSLVEMPKSSMEMANPLMEMAKSLVETA